MNEFLLKKRMLEELFERAEKNTYLRDIHGVDRNQIIELLDLLFRLLHAECEENGELNDSSGIFRAMEKRYISRFINNKDGKMHLDIYSKDLDPILKKIFCFVDYKTELNFYTNMQVMLGGCNFLEGMKQKQREKRPYLEEAPAFIEKDILNALKDSKSSDLADKIVYGDSLLENYLYRNKHIHNLIPLSSKKIDDMFNTVTEAYLCCVYCFKDKLDEKLSSIPDKCTISNNYSSDLAKKWESSIIFPEKSEILYKDECIDLEIKSRENRNRRGRRNTAEGTVKEALEDILNYKQALKVLVGPPGSGKTGCLAQFREFCALKNMEVLYFKLNAFVEKQCKKQNDIENGLDYLLSCLLEYMEMSDIEELEGRILLFDEFENCGLDGNTAGKLLSKIYDEWIGETSTIHELRIVIACRKNFLDVNSRDVEALSFIDIAPISSFSYITDIGNKLSWNCPVRDAILKDYTALLGIPYFGFQFLKRLQRLKSSDEEELKKEALFLLFDDMMCKGKMIQSKKYDLLQRESEKYIKDDVFELLNEFQWEMAFYMLKEKSAEAHWNYPLDETKSIFEKVFETRKDMMKSHKYEIDSNGKLVKRGIDFNYILSAGLFSVDYEQNTFSFLHSDLVVFLYSDKLIGILLPERNVSNQFELLMEYLSEIQLENINIKEYFKRGIEEAANDDDNKILSIFDLIAETLIQATLKGYKTVTHTAYEEAVERERLSKADNCLFVNCLTLLNWMNEIWGKDIIWKNYKERTLLNSAIRNMVSVINANDPKPIYDDVEDDNVTINFINMNLDRINLSKLYFGNANVENSDLKGAVFKDCNLTNVVFRDSSLDGACFKRIFASELFFYDSSLQNADFSHAVIRETDFCETDFQGTDLTNVNGLETCTFRNVKMNNAKLSCDEDYVLQITEEQFKNMIFDKLIIVDSNGVENIMSKDDIENTLFFYE